MAHPAIPIDVLNRFERACETTLPLWDIKFQRLCMLYEWFVGAGLADDHFDQHLVAAETYWQRLSEMLVAFKLMRAGCRLSSHSAGPDLWVQKGNCSFWIEVITPRPEGVDAVYLSQKGASPDGLLSVPMDQLLRRWTQAIDAKAGALMGTRDGKNLGYLQKGYVHPNEPYVIAVNGRHLRGPAGIGFNGCSTSPCAVEVLFALGPLQIRFDRMGKSDDHFRFSGIRRSRRPEIQSPNNSPISLTTFLDANFAPISAVWAMDIDETELLLDPPWPSIERNYFASAGVFNPLANNPLRVGDFPTFEDWTCEITGDAYQLMHYNRIPFRPSELSI